MTFAPDRPPVVVDASVAVALALHERQAVTAAWDGWIDEDRMLLATAVGWSEIGIALLHRLGGDPVEAALAVWSVQRAGLETADRGAAGVRFALGLAARHGLSVYDATYLWLAIDIDGELATLDQDLARAAEVEGVALALPGV
jgi:predicted nucleic acid-binding protein